MEQKTEASQAVKFRKKPVEIEAIQWTGKLDCLDAFNIPELHQSLGSDKVGIPTLEGTMIAHVGDWIIKGVKGEFYPCKPDIFELTYERAALKAQPAPTEARIPDVLFDGMAVYREIVRVRGRGYCGTTQVVSDTLDAVVRLLRSTPTEAAQGEDSARLDAERLPSMNPACGCEACNPQMIGWMMFICKLCGDKRCPHVANHVNPCQGRARASAETGGVKP